MRKLTVAAVALSAAGALVPTPSAQAGVPVAGPEGEPCRYVAVKDPNPEAAANHRTGVLMAGPAVTDVPGRMVCAIQIDAPSHNEPNAVTGKYPSDATNVIFGFQFVSYATAEGAKEYICTSFDPDDGSKPTVYWTEEPAPRWHTDPSKECSPATSVAREGVRDVVAPALCRELAAGHGWHANGNAYIDEEGDGFVDLSGDGIHENYPTPSPQDSQAAMDEMFYDCPVYTTTINSMNANPDRDDLFNPGVIDW